MPLVRHHKGMKIMVGLAFFVGEGLQTHIHSVKAQWL